MNDDAADPRPARFWRTIDELAGASPGEGATDDGEAGGRSIDRRSFFEIMGASMALASAAGCTKQPTEGIRPYALMPEQIVPGRASFFASAMPLGAVGTGVLVESHEGRPTKVEGNLQHPTSLGATSAFEQAAVLGLYDPARSQAATRFGRIEPWASFLTAMRVELAVHRSDDGARVRILTEATSSPSLIGEIRAFLEAFPQAKWHRYEPAARDGRRAGARAAFGVDVEPLYAFERADVIVTLDADILSPAESNPRYIRDFASRRVPTGPMSRLYAVESTPGLTGAKADHRLSMPAHQVEVFARLLARLLGVDGEPVPPEVGQREAPPRAADPALRFAEAVARDLDRHRGTSVVVAGDQQPAAVHAIAHTLNHALGNVGVTLVFIEPSDPHPHGSMQSLRELVADMDAGKVGLLLILGGNPAYAAPGELGFADKLARIEHAAHLSTYANETSLRCRWHLPEAHWLEAWGDTRGHDGTVTIMQPLIAPLYGGHSAIELLAQIGDRPDRTAYDIVREHARREVRSADFDSSFQLALHDGVIKDSAPREVRVRARPLSEALRDASPPAPARGAQGELEVAFRLDPSTYDGRFAENAWLQELPHPLTKITWSNAALIGPGTASRLGLATGDVVRLERSGASIEAPICVVPAHAEGSLTLPLGGGRRRAGPVGSSRGFDANAIRSSDSPGFTLGVRLEKTGARRPFASTQTHHTMAGRDLVRSATIGLYASDPMAIHEQVREKEPPRSLTLYKDYPYPGHAWGMTIDLATCVGCNACIAACQAENNVPVVGPDEVARGREMHWLRVDHYYEGPVEAPRQHFMPVPCMHCELAPCEVVCPVDATVHGAEGLNEMVYNRCVGTRYCSNNCPYKVRRFNFYPYATRGAPGSELPPRRGVLDLLANPDVTVRSRGVMEKCTYCVQRINAGRSRAAIEDRRVRDGEVMTACQAVCPAGAIVFGDVNDRASEVSTRKREPRNYALLGELNTRPRTTYLASVRNPNAELEGREP
jgi:Fe-S-cluster-containing dehydrogenase component